MKSVPFKKSRECDHSIGAIVSTFETGESVRIARMEIVGRYPKDRTAKHGGATFFTALKGEGDIVAGDNAIRLLPGEMARVEPGEEYFIRSQKVLAVIVFEQMI